MNPKVGGLFINFGQPKRMRVKGTASFHEDDDLLRSREAAQLMVRVRAERTFPICPRYIHCTNLVEPSVYAARPGPVPPVPAWKQMDVFRDHLPRWGKPV